MASNKFLVSIVLNSLLATSILFHPSHTASELLHRVCDRCSDSQYCLNVFASDSRSNSADLQGLGKLSIQIAILKLHATIEKFPDLRRKITDGVGQERLKVCESDYQTAVQKYGGAFGSTDKRDYSGVVNWVRDGTNVVIHCQNIYRMSEPISESPISADNHDIINLSGVILTVNDMLMGL